jgi:hypothetical protein
VARFDIHLTTISKFFWDALLHSAREQVLTAGHELAFARERLLVNGVLFVERSVRNRTDTPAPGGHASVRWIGESNARQIVSLF